MHYIGQNVPRVDAIEKVTGKAKYTGDLSIAGMLHGKILRGPLAHARIKRIDIAEAESLPGVAAVLTAADLSDIYPFYSGRPVIAMDKVRYAGEPVAAVAAEDLRTAEEASALVHVDYEELPPFVGLDAALRGDAPLIHDDAPRNICSHERVEKGDVAEGFADADQVFEDIFTFPMVYHYAMEPHTAIAEWNDEGIKVWSS
ncbi:MAG: xanthine dehydrogenase family protein molybdopterin-binding subunit, partial [Candidatus Binatia bacterium]